MRRRFNVTGPCNPEKHYMVELNDRLHEMKEKYVDCGSYFVINRARQYGKTTTMKALAKCLSNEYIVLSLDFQKMASKKFADETSFTRGFADKLLIALRNVESDDKGKLQDMLLDFKVNNSDPGMDELFECLSSMCAVSTHPVVLMIDEVDSASNNQVFVDFLAQLRGYYLEREETPIFHSVILAGVYDIKNLKLKLRSETEHKYNSPWNIAAKFKIDMSFSTEQISCMLEEYKADQHVEMNVQETAEEIYAYTSGYPVLVSEICKYIDEDLMEEKCFENLNDAWTTEGVKRAVKIILDEKSPLFESMRGHVSEYPDMRDMLYAILFQGESVSYNADNEVMDLTLMFGYAEDRAGKVEIANRIFETRLYNYFLSQEELSSLIGGMAKRDKGYFIHDGRLDMGITLRKFVEYFNDIYGEKDEKFIENCGRKLFLLYLKPIINGIGNYYIEAQTRDAKRTDVIVDYLGEQFIIELKIWHGEEYNKRGEMQLADYLDYYHKDKGYMVSFNFNRRKETGIKEIWIGNRVIVEAVV